MHLHSLVEVVCFWRQAAPRILLGVDKAQDLSLSRSSSCTGEGEWAGKIVFLADSTSLKRGRALHVVRRWLVPEQCAIRIGTKTLFVL